jgi:hypothetical protein
MNKYSRYSVGFTVGMCLEYIYRVNSEVWYIPCGIAFLGSILMVIDMTHSDN